MSTFPLSQLSPRNKFILSRWAYSVGKPFITDAEYNELLAYMQANFPEDEYVNRSWSSDPCPTELLKSVGMEDLIQSVVLADKTESIPSLNSFVEYRTVLGSINEIGTVSMKHDGWNIQINYFNGRIVNVHTRGRYTDAVDVTALQEKFPQTIPYAGSCKVVCELTISKENFKFCRAQFGNKTERSAVSTVLARPEYHNLLDAHAFAIHGCDLKGQNKFVVLRQWGFQTPGYIETKSFDDINKALEQLSAMKENYPSPTDGVVYAGSLMRAIRLLGWEEPIYKSYVTGYTEKYSAYRISPSVEIRPVLRDGTTQRQISLTNWSRIIDYNLQPGAPIAFRCASDAIADFDEDSTRLLHGTWYGKWDEYRRFVDLNEENNLWKSRA